MNWIPCTDCTEVAGDIAPCDEHKTRSLVPESPDLSLKGRIARKADLHARLIATEARHAAEGNLHTADLFGEMATEVAAEVMSLQAEGRQS